MTDLHITTQAPATFANQQWGKRHCFHIIVRASGETLKAAIVAASTSSPLRLEAQLVYANDLAKEVSMNSRSCSKRKNMLQILDQRDFDAEGEAEVLCRINDVSRNHQGRQFCVRLRCCGADRKTIASCITTPIKVISKQPKRGRQNTITAPADKNTSKRRRRVYQGTVKQWESRQTAAA